MSWIVETQAISDPSELSAAAAVTSAMKRVPSLRISGSSKLWGLPVSRARPKTSSSSRKPSSTPSGGQNGQGAAVPISSPAVKPSSSQSTLFTWARRPSRPVTT
jgi:hypothetical protein